jgi:hypothetical protein
MHGRQGIGRHARHWQACKALAGMHMRGMRGPSHVIQAPGHWQVCTCTACKALAGMHMRGMQGPSHVIQALLVAHSAKVLVI